MTLPDDKGECKCGGLSRMAEDPKNPVEFDPQLNEFHIMQKGDGGYSLIHFCPWCGGRAPQSHRSSLFQRVTAPEQQRLRELTKNLQTEQDVIAALGEPDQRHPGAVRVTAAEREGLPEATRTCNVLTYTRLSELANVNVLVYPTGRVEVSLQGKPVLVQQKHEHRMLVGPPSPSEPEPQIDTSKRYDVYCTEPGQKIVVYRNARFKSAGSLLSAPGVRTGYSQFIELEQANGQTIFVSRQAIFRFCEPGTEALAEQVR